MLANLRARSAVVNLVTDRSALWAPEYNWIPRQRLSSRGNPFIVWGPAGMPRINDKFLNCVFYLYRDRRAAEGGENAGGTGFWVGYEPEESAGGFYIFAVSNKHVIADGGASVIRVNTIDGGVEIFEIEPHEWYFDAKDDLAVTHVFLDLVKHKINVIPMTMFVTREIMKSYDLGPGDEVFMVGRFIKLDGKTTNIPSVRFGSLSIPDSIIDHPLYAAQESFAVEMRSMAGYSGSPVFIWPSQWNMNSGGVTVGIAAVFLLGVDWGHIVDQLEVEQRRISAVPSAAQAPTTISFVRANTGMNGVVPAWSLSELIKSSPIAENMRRHAKAEAVKKAAAGPSTVVDVASVSAEDEKQNPRHREDFTSLLNAAAKTKPQDDQT